MHILVTLAAMLLVGLSGQAAAQGLACTVNDLASLRACMGSAAAGGRISFAKDVVCRSVGECCPGGLALVRVMNIAGLAIDGKGHSLRREAAQKSCAAMVVRNSPNLTVANLTFDEDAKAAPCALSDKPCASTFDIGNTKGVLMDRVRVLFGKGYVIKLWTVDDFTFRRSEVADAGIIGFYAGHYRFGASHRLVLEDSSFLRARTNGVALQFDTSNRLSNTNDIAANTQFAGITFLSTGGAFTLAGNVFNLTGNLINSNAAVQTVNLVLMLASMATAIGLLWWTGQAEPNRRVGSRVVPVIIAAPRATESPIAQRLLMAGYSSSRK